MKEQNFRKLIETRRKRIPSNRSTHTGDKKGARNRAERGECKVPSLGEIPALHFLGIL